MFGFIDLAQAKEQIRRTDIAADSDIQEKIYEATAIIMTYCEWDTIPDKWVVNTSPLTYEIPYDVQSATKLEVAELFANREGGTSNVLSEGVRRLLRHYYNPPLG
jgi:hypothetical protein